MLSSEITNTPSGVQAFSVEDLIGDLPEAPAAANDPFGDLGLFDDRPVMGPDFKESLRFLKAIRPKNGVVALYSLEPDEAGTGVGKEGKPFRKKSAFTACVGKHDAAILDFLKDQDAKGWHLYYALNEPGLELGHHKPAEDDIHVMYGLAADLDPHKDRPFADERGRLIAKADQMLAGPNPPTFVIDSGSGIQMLWITKPAVVTDDTRTRFRQHGYGLFERFLAAGENADNTSSIEHLFRLPGAVNVMGPKKVALGRTPARARIIGETRKLYDPEHLDVIAPAATPKGKSAKAWDSETARRVLPWGLSFEALKDAIAHCPNETVGWKEWRLDGLAIRHECTPTPAMIEMGLHRKIIGEGEARELYHELSAKIEEHHPGAYDVEATDRGFDECHNLNGRLGIWRIIGKAEANGWSLLEWVLDDLRGLDWSACDAVVAELKRREAEAEAEKAKEPDSPFLPAMPELLTRAAAMGPETSPEDIRDLLTAAAALRPKEIELATLFRAVKSATKCGLGELRADFRAIQKDSRDAVDIAHTVADEVVKKSFDGHLLRADDRSFWRYTGTHWTRVADDVVLGRCIARARAHDLGDSDLRRVADNALRLLAGMQARDGDVLGLLRVPPPVVNCTNGELWLSADGKAELRPHRPESYLKHCLPVAYDPAATCPRYDKALLEVFGAASDPADMARHWGEFVGYVMQPQRDIATWWLLQGSGANGKTMLISVLEALLSADAVLSTNIARAATDRFLIGSMVGKLMVKDDDVNSNTKLPDKFLKEFGEGKATTGELKFKSHFSFVSVAVPVLLANNWPKTDDVSNGYRRRARVVPFARQFEEAEQDLTLGRYIIATELAGVLNRALEGLQRLRARGRFDDPADCRTAKDRFFQSANTVAGFVAAKCCVKVGGQVVGNELWLAYQTWASAEGLRAVPSRQGFYDAIEALGYPTGEINKGVAVYGLVLSSQQPEPAADEFESI